jgi:hypothetical protein
MGEFIADNAKREAMKNPFLRELLMSDSIYIGSNITFDNLAPLSTYLGKPGNPDLGGVPFEEYMRRQEQHHAAEVSALLDTVHFINRAQDLYGYDHFVCDTGGSICEVVDANDPNDPVMTALAQNTLMVWIKGSDAHAEELARRFDKAPKPMFYKSEFLKARWSEYLAENAIGEDEVDPNAFVRWTYSKALAHRQPRYEAMSKWGITVTAEEVAEVRTTEDFNTLIAEALRLKSSET